MIVLGQNGVREAFGNRFYYNAGHHYYWVSSMLMVKKVGKFWVCVDYRVLKAFIIKKNSNPKLHTLKSPRAPPPFLLCYRPAKNYERNWSPFFYFFKSNPTSNTLKNLQAPPTTTFPLCYRPAEKYEKNQRPKIDKIKIKIKFYISHPKKPASPPLTRLSSVLQTSKKLWEEPTLKKKLESKFHTLKNRRPPPTLLFYVLQTNREQWKKPTSKTKTQNFLNLTS